MDHDYYRTKKNSCKMYRQCRVPLCNNSSSTTPDKLFLKVPVEMSVRKQWLAAAGVFANKSGYAKTPNYFFCEDHFELEKDIENYMAYKMGFLKRVRIKNGIMPSKFTCQHSEFNSPINSFIKMNVLEGKNILAIETIPNKPEDAQSGLIINVGQHVLYKTTFVKEDKSNNIQHYHKEYYKFLKPKIKTENLQENIVYTYDNLYLINQQAFCIDHDYCKKNL